MYVSDINFTFNDSFMALLIRFFGPIERVYSVSKNVINKLEAEDTIISTLEFSNGIVGTIEATTGCRPKDYEVSLSIIGSKGIVEIDGLLSGFLSIILREISFNFWI